MTLRAAALALALVFMTMEAVAADPKLPDGFSCSDVRAKVEEHGQYIAYAWARLHGYSRYQIKQARKCLKG